LVVARSDVNARESAELCPDLLVEQTGDYQCHHVMLTAAECRVAISQITQLGLTTEQDAALLDRARD
jgi:hypothetical protein